MKKIKIFTMAVAALLIGLTSCSKEESNGVDAGDAKNITVLFDNGNANSRAIDSPASDGTTKTTFAKGQLIFANAGVVTDTYEIVSTATDLTAKKINIGEITTGYGVTFFDMKASDVYVLGNMSFATTIVTGSHITNDLLKTMLDETHLTNGLYQNAVLYGTSKVIEAAVTANPNTGAPSDYYANVTIAPLAARIEIEEIKETTGAYTFEVEAIYINNYYENMTIGGVGSNMKTHIAGGFTTANYLGATSTFHDILQLTPAAGSFTPATGKVWAYQMFPAENATTGDDNLPHIVVHMKNLKKGSFDIFDNYYITIATYGTTKKIEKGKVYTISSISFDASKHGDIIPESSLIDIDVAISVAAWEPAILVPDIN